MSKRIFLIAGEASGDLQGALLLRELKKMMPDIQLRGLGGPMMAAEGVELLCDLTKESVLGLGDVLRKYFWFKSVFDRALREVERWKPDAIILIDYPGFNLRFAKKIKKRFPVIYYISPQIWAWGGRRISTIRKTVNHMIVFFQFEADLYKKEHVPVTWVGHPLVETVKPSRPSAELRRELTPPNVKDFKLITLFPGSRKTEVERILPEMLKAAHALGSRLPNLHFLLSASPALEPKLYDDMIRAQGRGLALRTFLSKGYDLLAASDFAMISSGTATLEAALSGVPFVILYKASQSTFFLGRLLVQIPYIGLINVVAGRKIVPEFLQHEIHPEKIADEAIYLMEHKDLRDKMLVEIKEATSKLGPPGAALRAAEAVEKIINSA